MARTIPGPRGQWFVGDITAYQRDRLAWLADSKETYGDVVRLAPRIVAVHDAGLAHEILAATNDVYTVDNGLRAGRRHRDLIEAHLDEWMHVRRDVWRSIADRATRAHADRFAGQLESGLRRHEGCPIDVVTACRDLMGSAIVDFCFGAEQDGCLLTEVRVTADRLFVSALASLVNGEGRVAWVPRPAARATVAANGALLGLIEGLVRRRLTGPVPDEPRDLLDGLLAGTAGDGAALDRTVHVLRTIIFASHGVPGAALSWLVLLLADHPDASARVVAEGAAGPFTEAFLKEALRLHPPQWLLTRTSSRPVEVGGYRIPAGTEVLVCPYLMHRDRRWWHEPERFAPQRWLQDEKPHARHSYLPFGAGPRICPGSLLATIHLTRAMVLLARDYRLDMPPLAKVTPTTDGLMWPADLTGGWYAESS